MAATGELKEDIDRAGRWRPEESAEYVRVSKQIVCRSQSRLADKIRSSKGADVCLENDLIRDLGVYCKAHGAAGEDIEEMIHRIREVRALCTGGEALAGELGAPPLDDCPPAVAGVIDLDDERSLDDLIADVQEIEEIGEGQFVVSTQENGKLQTLHRTGSCWRIPGLHYARYIVLDEGEEREGKFDKLCIDRFPKSKNSKELTVETTSESDSSSSSSSSS